jgi:hypothetical protein
MYSLLLSQLIQNQTQPQPTLQPQPMLTVISPNGGETYYFDQNNTNPKITVSISKSNTNSGVDLYLTSQDGYELYNISKNILSSDYTFAIPSQYIQKDVNYFKIKVCLSQNNNICDLSDNYFKVVSSQILSL